MDKDQLRRPMTEKELSELAGVPGVTIGPHTVTHRRLSSLSREDYSGEVTRSIAWLQGRGLETGKFFAYPFGQKPDMAQSVSIVMREHGYEPLTTLPVLVNRSSIFWLRRWGLPRLSVGPAETPLMSLLVKILPLASRVTPLWLMALGIRRKLIISNR
jgi:peptidoglycan/xylan/chitin deacetylase (PgdA/CDA1 family)